MSRTVLPLPSIDSIAGGEGRLIIEPRGRQRRRQDSVFEPDQPHPQPTEYFPPCQVDDASSLRAFPSTRSDSRMSDATINGASEFKKIQNMERSSIRFADVDMPRLYDPAIEESHGSRWSFFSKLKSRLSFSDLKQATSGPKNPTDPAKKRRFSISSLRGRKTQEDEGEKTLKSRQSFVHSLLRPSKSASHFPSEFGMAPSKAQTRTPIQSLRAKIGLGRVSRGDLKSSVGRGHDQSTASQSTIDTEYASLQSIKSRWAFGSCHPDDLDEKCNDREQYTLRYRHDLGLNKIEEETSELLRCSCNDLNRALPSKHSSGASTPMKTQAMAVETDSFCEKHSSSVELIVAESPRDRSIQAGSDYPPRFHVHVKEMEQDSDTSAIGDSLTEHETSEKPAERRLDRRLEMCHSPFLAGGQRRPNRIPVRVGIPNPPKYDFPPPQPFGHSMASIESDVFQRKRAGSDKENEAMKVQLIDDDGQDYRGSLDLFGPGIDSCSSTESSPTRTHAQVWQTVLEESPSMTLRSLPSLKRVAAHTGVTPRQTPTPDSAKLKRTLSELQNKQSHGRGSPSQRSEGRRSNRGTPGKMMARAGSPLSLPAKIDAKAGKQTASQPSDECIRRKLSLHDDALNPESTPRPKYDYSSLERALAEVENGTLDWMDSVQQKREADGDSSDRESIMLVTKSGRYLQLTEPAVRIPIDGTDDESID